MDTDARERIERYIQRTKFKSNAKNYGMRTSEWLALCRMIDTAKALGLAFQYGKAKGYRAAKAERRAAV